MDQRAREALEAELRRVAANALDEFAGELVELRRSVRLLERAAGLASDRLAPDERRALVGELRERGLSAQRIASTVNTHRVTVFRDLRELGAPRPARTIGVDGTVRRHGPRTGPRSSADQ